MISAKLRKLLNKNTFLTLATSDNSGKPNSAPMFLIKADEEHIYMIDYTMGATFRNLKENPRVSVSLSEPATLKGFKFNGSVKIINEGPVHKKIFVELESKILKLTTDRVVKGVQQKVVYKNFEVGMLEDYVVYKIDVKEITEIGPKGSIKKSQK